MKNKTRIVVIGILLASIILIGLVSALDTYSLNSIQERSSLTASARLLNITIKSSNINIKDKNIIMPISVYKYPWKSQEQINRELDDLTEARLSQLNINFTRTTEKLSLDSLSLSIKSILNSIALILERLANYDAKNICEMNCLAPSHNFDEYKLCMEKC